MTVLSSDNLIYGLHAIAAIVQHAPERLLAIYVQADRQDDRMLQLLNKIEQLSCPLHRVSQKTLNELVGANAEHVRHQGIIAHCKPSEVLSESALADLVTDVENPIFLILDQVQDPHNLGACLRSADGAGVTAVIAPKDKAVSLTATVRKVASGAAETVPFIQVTNLARTLVFLQQAGIWLYGLDDSSEQTLYEADFTTGGIALVLGAEGSGLRRLTREHCDHLIAIPMHGSVSSLNVSVATGVCVYEVARQRSLQPKS